MTEQEIRTERSLIGFALDGKPKALEFVKTWEMRDPLAAQIAAVIRELVSEGREFSTLTVTNRLSARGQDEAVQVVLDPMGMYAAGSTPSECIKLLRNGAQYRALVAAGSDLTKAAAAQEGTPEAIIETTLEKLRGVLDEDVKRRKVFSPADAVAAVEDMQNAAQLKTGIEVIDRAVGRIRKGDVILIGASTGEGKSSLILQTAVSMARSGMQVVYAGLEMAESDYGERLCQLDGYAAPFSSTVIASEVEAYRGLGLTFVRHRTVSEIRSALAMMKQLPDVLCVDYLQLLGAEGRTPYERATAVSSGLLALALDLNIAVIVASQLSRAPKAEKREPMLSDFRDSGTIEQDAAIAILLSTVEQDDAKKRGVSDLFARLKKKGQRLSALNVAKNRHGDRRRGPVGFDSAHVRFVDVSSVPGSEKWKN